MIAVPKIGEAKHILLALVNALALFLLAVPLPRTVHWMRHLAPIALLVAIA